MMVCFATMPCGSRTGSRYWMLTTEKMSRYTFLLLPAVQKWNVTHKSRPAEVRIAANSAIHDRIIGIDRQAVWIVTQ